MGGAQCTVLTSYNPLTASTFFANFRYTSMAIGNDVANGATPLRGSIHDLRVTAAGKQYDGDFAPLTALSRAAGPVAFWLGTSFANRAGAEPPVKQGTPVETLMSYAL